jgi:hypothetical protein
LAGGKIYVDPFQLAAFKLEEIEKHQSYENEDLISFGGEVPTGLETTSATALIATKQSSFLVLMSRNKPNERKN